MNPNLEYRCKKCGHKTFNKYAIFHHSCFEDMIEVRPRKAWGWSAYNP